MRQDLKNLHEALLDLTGVMNQPRPDASLIALAGVELDRALFPLLVRIERKGPLAIGELAGLCGRDYSTVSRQVAKLESLGLVARRADAQDARITNAAITKNGKAMARALDRAREQRMTSLLRAWERSDIAELARLLRRLADDAMKLTS